MKKLRDRKDLTIHDVQPNSRKWFTATESRLVHDQMLCAKTETASPTFSVDELFYFSSLLGPVDPSCQALSGRLKFTFRRHKFNKDSLFSTESRSIFQKISFRRILVEKGHHGCTSTQQNTWVLCVRTGSWTCPPRGKRAPRN